MIDISKCIGCKRGTSCWTKEKEGFYHMDLFATPEAGNMYPCRTEGIENYIHENIVGGKPAGIYLANEDVKQFFNDQELWWEDACDIAREVFKDDQEAIGEFFNQGEKGDMMWNRSREVVEEALMKLVKEKEIKLNPEDYAIIKVIRGNQIAGSQGPDGPTDEIPPVHLPENPYQGQKGYPGPEGVSVTPEQRARIMAMVEEVRPRKADWEKQSFMVRLLHRIFG